MTIPEKRALQWIPLLLLFATAYSYSQGTLAQAARAGIPTISGPGTPSGGVGTLAQRIGHFDRSKTHILVGAHDGPGTMEIERLLGPQSLSTSFQFLDEALVNPHGGLGEHFHDNCEEMFIALEGPDAQFTINGHTSVLQTPAGAPDRMGSAHAFYDPTDQPILWLDFGVGNFSKAHDGFNLGDDRVGVPVEKIPQFVNWHMDPKLLKPVERMEGGVGTVMYRRLLGPAQFYTPWAYTDEISIPAGSTIGPSSDLSMSEVYFVLSGAGTVTVNGETVNIKQYDAIPVDLGQTHSFAQTGSEPLHLLVNGIAKDRNAKKAFIDRPENAGGGASRPGFPPPGRPIGN
jgi:mannose-6-phosphate isomerase-like protein (cupin superfamily)